MFYFNPYHLLHLEPNSPEEVDAVLIRQAKRRLLAEFELEEGVTIEVLGVELDKSQALGLLDELEDAKRKQYHWQILQQPALLLVLTEPRNGRLEAVPDWTSLPDEGFRNFLSPYLAQTLAWILSESMKAKAYHRIGEVAAKSTVLKAVDLERAFAPVHRQANQGIEQMQEWVDKPKDLHFRDKVFWELIDRNLLKGLNSLPGRFQNLRNRYASSLVNLSVALSNVLKHKFLASKVIGNADLLEVDVHVKSKVEYVKRQLIPGGKRPKRKRPALRFKKPERMFPFVLRGFGLGVLLMVVLFCIGFIHECTHRPISSKEVSTSTRPEQVSLEYAQRIRLFNQLNEYAFEQKAIGLESEVSVPENGMHGEQPYGYVLGYNPILEPQSRPYIFRNESNQDAVIFMMPDFPKHACLHYYVASDSQKAFHSAFEGSMTLQAFAGEEWENGVLPYFTPDGNVNLGAFKRATYRLSTDQLDQDSTLMLMTNVLERRWLEDNAVAEQMGMHVDSPVVFILKEGQLRKEGEKE